MDQTLLRPWRKLTLDWRHIYLTEQTSIFFCNFFECIKFQKCKVCNISDVPGRYRVINWWYDTNRIKKVNIHIEKRVDLLPYILHHRWKKLITIIIWNLPNHTKLFISFYIYIRPTQYILRMVILLTYKMQKLMTFSRLCTYLYETSDYMENYIIRPLYMAAIWKFRMATISI